MEELGFVWLEEPFHEQKMHHYQELCTALDMPVMANEMLMHAPVVEDGHLAPTDLPGWGAEWDEDRFQSLVVAER